MLLTSTTATKFYQQVAEPSIADRYEALIAANAKVAENILPKKRKRKGIVFRTPDLIHARNLLKSCAIKNRIKSTSSTRTNLQSAKESLGKVYSKQLDQNISTKTAQIERLHAERQSAKAWETILELTIKKSSPLSKVKGDTKEEHLKTLNDHFKSFLNHPRLTFQMITSTEKFQIIFLLILANLL